VETALGSGSWGVRSFAIDCEPLRRHQVWLVTGLREVGEAIVDVAVVIPHADANVAERAEIGQTMLVMPDRHALFVPRFSLLHDQRAVEALVLGAYGTVMA
jgi:hypothetical protein